MAVSEKFSGQSLIPSFLYSSSSFTRTLDPLNYNMPVQSDDNLSSILNNAKRATIRDAVKKVGFRGLFTHGLFTHGLPLRIAMLGTLSSAQWGIYDAFKLYVGLPTSGGVAHAAVEL